MFVHGDLFSELDLFPKMSAAIDFDLSWLHPWNKNIVQSLNKTKWSLYDTNDLGAMKITFLQFGSILAQVHFGSFCDPT